MCECRQDKKRNLISPALPHHSVLTTGRPLRKAKGEHKWYYWVPSEKGKEKENTVGERSPTTLRQLSRETTGESRAYEVLLERKGQAGKKGGEEDNQGDLTKSSHKVFTAPACEIQMLSVHVTGHVDPSCCSDRHPARLRQL